VGSFVGGNVGIGDGNDVDGRCVGDGDGNKDGAVGRVVGSVVGS